MTKLVRGKDGTRAWQNRAYEAAISSRGANGLVAGVPASPSDHYLRFGTGTSPIDGVRTYSNEYQLPRSQSGTSNPVWDGDSVLLPGTDWSSNEAYAKVNDNPFAAVAAEPLSTFSIDVDTGSYSNIRRFLEQGSLP